MSAKERDTILYGLLRDYVLEKERNRVWQREASSSYSYISGKLVGFMMAFGLEMEEYDTTIKVKKSDSQRYIMNYHTEGDVDNYKQKHVNINKQL